MALHYLVVYVCSAAAASYIANPLPTYHRVILLFTNPGERENLFEECVFVYLWGHAQSCLVRLRMCVCLYVYFAKGDDYLFTDATHKIP